LELGERAHPEEKGDARLRSGSKGGDREKKGRAERKKKK